MSDLQQVACTGAWTRSRGIDWMTRLSIELGQTSPTPQILPVLKALTTPLWQPNNLFDDTRTKSIIRKHSWRKGYARQQCVCEGSYGRNLSSAGNSTLEPNITSLYVVYSRSYASLSIWKQWRPSVRRLVQGHPRSSTLVPIKSPYSTSY